MIILNAIPTTPFHEDIESDKGVGRNCQWDSNIGKVTREEILTGEAFEKISVFYKLITEVLRNHTFDLVYL